MDTKTLAILGVVAVLILAGAIWYLGKQQTDGGTPGDNSTGKPFVQSFGFAAN